MCVCVCVCVCVHVRVFCVILQARKENLAVQSKKAEFINIIYLFFKHSVTYSQKCSENVSSRVSFCIHNKHQRTHPGTAKSDSELSAM